VPINAACSLQVRIATAAEASGPIKTVFHSWPFPDQVPVVQRRGNGYVLELDDKFDFEEREWRQKLTGEGLDVLDMGDEGEDDEGDEEEDREAFLAMLQHRMQMEGLDFDDFM
jgi:hypothetical protein